MRLRAAVPVTCPEYMPELDLAQNTGLRLVSCMEWEREPPWARPDRTCPHTLAAVERLPGATLENPNDTKTSTRP